VRSSRIIPKKAKYFQTIPFSAPSPANYDTAQPYGKAAAKPGRTRTTPVGSLGNANGFGLFDMHGNVIEWVADVYHDGLPSKPSVWRAGGDSRFWVARGGGWNSPGYAVRSAFRYRIPPANLDSNLGFRLALGE
jgi:formylglycine-generating enzyme required for sulfatase activity